MPLIDPIIDDSEFNSSGEQNPVLFLDLRHILEIRAVRPWREQDADAHAFTGSHPDTMPAHVKASRQVPGVRVSDFPLTEMVDLFGLLVVGFDEFVPFAGLPFQSIVVSRAGSPCGSPASTGNCDCVGCCAAPCACVTSCRVVSVLVVSVLSSIRAPSLSCCPYGHPSGSCAAPVFVAGHGITP